jgi:hypothetical protein
VEGAEIREELMDTLVEIIGVILIWIVLSAVFGVLVGKYMKFE